MLSWIGGTFVFCISLWVMLDELQWNPAASLVVAVILTAIVVGLLQPYEEQ